MSSSMRWRSGLTDEQGAVRVGWDIGACSKMTVIHHAGSPARTRSTVHRRSAPALNLPEGPIPRSGFVHGRKAEWLLSVGSRLGGGLGDAGMRFSECATTNDLRV